MKPLANREAWLHAVAEHLRPLFKEKGYTLPPFRVGLGFTSKGENGTRIGECWTDRASGDGHHEIFISPVLDDPLIVAGVLAHELCHAAVGIPAGHGPLFRKCAVAIGLKGPMTATSPDEAFEHFWELVGPLVGPMPHAKLHVSGCAPRIEKPEDEAEEAEPEVISSGPKKQTTRLLKASCAEDGCGYTVRVTRKWALTALPVCPIHSTIMTVEGLDDEA